MLRRSTFPLVPGTFKYQEDDQVAIEVTITSKKEYSIKVSCDAEPPIRTPSDLGLTLKESSSLPVKSLYVVSSDSESSYNKFIGEVMSTCTKQSILNGNLDGFVVLSHTVIVMQFGPRILLRSD